MNLDKYQNELNEAIIQKVDDSFMVGDKIVEKVLNDYHLNMVPQTLCVFQYWLANNYKTFPTDSAEMTIRARLFIKEFNQKQYNG